MFSSATTAYSGHALWITLASEISIYKNGLSDTMGEGMRARKKEFMRIFLLLG
jgi:hypothetical protein